MITTTLLSFLLFLVFNFLTIRKNGILPSYSATYYKWGRNDTVSVFSLVTFAVALLLMPAMIEQGEGHVLQFLGFMAPIYLIIVAIRPDFEADENTFRVHSGAAVICAALSFVWVIWVKHLWWVLLIGVAVSAVLACITKTARASKVFWLEMIMFVSVYLALVIG